MSETATTSPLVSVVIPVHNAGNLLVEALDSVYAQTFRDFEVFVIDDASTDNADERLQNYPHPVNYIRQRHAGSAVARNRGVMRARGRYIAFLDADDTWAETKLEKQVALLENSPDVVLAYSDFERAEQQQADKRSGVGARKHRVEGEDFLSLLRQNFLHTSSVVVRREALSEAGIFDPKLRNAQDWDLWVRLAEIGQLGYVDEILTHYRLHENQTVKSPKFPRNVVYADRLMLARYSNDPDLTERIKAKLGSDLWLLGRRELKNGNASRARKAFMDSIGVGYRRAGSFARVIYCMLPGIVRRKSQVQENPSKS